MCQEIHQVLRVCMLLARQQPRLKNCAGLLVVIWPQTQVQSQTFYCTVAAAGPRHRKTNEENLQAVLTDVDEGTLPRLLWSITPDPEEIRTFCDAFGSLKLTLTFQLKDNRCVSPAWQAGLESFLHMFSLANAAIAVRLVINLIPHRLERNFRAKFRSKAAQSPFVLDVTRVRQPQVNVSGVRWCDGGHAVLGTKLPLSIPPEVMDRGLYGELSAQLVFLLTPCMHQLPNLQTNLRRIQVMFYSPSKLPIIGPSNLLKSLPTDLDCQDLGLHSIQWSGLTDPSTCDNIVFSVEADPSSESRDQQRCSSIEQNLSVFVFLQHCDPFTSHLSEVISAETLHEHHLEAILSNNRLAVTSAFQSDLRNTMKSQHERRKNQRKLSTAVEVILNSTMSIVSFSSNMDFRKACLTHMKVFNTRDLSTSLCESLTRVTSWKFVPSSRCFSTREEEVPEPNHVSRPEM